MRGDLYDLPPRVRLRRRVLRQSALGLLSGPDLRLPVGSGQRRGRQGRHRHDRRPQQPGRVLGDRATRTDRGRSARSRATPLAGPVLPAGYHRLRPLYAGLRRPRALQHVQGLPGHRARRPRPAGRGVAGCLSSEPAGVARGLADRAVPPRVARHRLPGRQLAGERHQAPPAFHDVDRQLQLGGARGHRVHACRRTPRKSRSRPRARRSPERSSTPTTTSSRACFRLRPAAALRIRRSTAATTSSCSSPTASTRRGRIPASAGPRAAGRRAISAPWLCPKARPGRRAAAQALDPSVRVSGIPVYVVGLNTNPSFFPALNCIADESGGQLFAADDEDDLLKALQSLLDFKRSANFFASPSLPAFAGGFGDTAQIGAVVPSHLNENGDLSSWSIWSGTVKSYQLDSNGLIPVVTAAAATVTPTPTTRRPDGDARGGHAHADAGRHAAGRVPRRNRPEQRQPGPAQAGLERRTRPRLHRPGRRSGGRRRSLGGRPDVSRRPRSRSGRAAR